MIARKANGAQLEAALQPLVPMDTTMPQELSLRNGIHVLLEENQHLLLPSMTNAMVLVVLETTAEREQLQTIACAQLLIMCVHPGQLREQSVTMEAMLAQETLLMPLAVILARLEASAMVQHLRPNAHLESLRAQVQGVACLDLQVSMWTIIQLLWVVRLSLLLTSGHLKEILRRETA